jgi:hypothetical protein
MAGCILTCEQCGVQYRVKPSRKAKSRFCSRKCRAAHDRGRHRVEDCCLIGHSGYRMQLTNGILKREHRIVMENTLGRALLPSEFVHHKNGERSDNRPDNLAVTNIHDHGRIHNPQRYPSTKACAMCGREFAPHKTKRKRAVTCSRECFRLRMKQIWSDRRATLSRCSSTSGSLKQKGLKDE